MLAACLRFVRGARGVAGVQRISLIGSLATAKPYPKDIDLIVTVADEMELDDLARLGRQLAGTIQRINGGADVFLSSPDGEYLGRTCPWRECGPGIRVRCGADYRSGRQYLRDDLHAVKLPRALIGSPSAELWPIARALVSVPPDVERALMDRLRLDASTGSTTAT
jgi:hypothetical protein